jgi:hypothetical protein
MRTDPVRSAQERQSLLALGKDLQRLGMHPRSPSATGSGCCARCPSKSRLHSLIFEAKIVHSGCACRGRSSAVQAVRGTGLHRVPGKNCRSGVTERGRQPN